MKDELDILIEQILLQEGIFSRKKKNKEQPKQADPNDDPVYHAIRKIKYLLSILENDYIPNKQHESVNAKAILDNATDSGSNLFKLLTGYTKSPEYVIAKNKGYILLVQLSIQKGVFESLDMDETDINVFKKYISILNKANNNANSVMNQIFSYCTKNKIQPDLKQQVLKQLQQDNVEVKNIILKYFKEL